MQSYIDRVMSAPTIPKHLRAYSLTLNGETVYLSNPAELPLLFPRWRYKPMHEIIETLKPSNEVMRRWLQRYRSCFTGPDYNALEGCLTHFPDCYTQEEILLLIIEELATAGKVRWKRWWGRWCFTRSADDSRTAERIMVSREDDYGSRALVFALGASFERWEINSKERWLYAGPSESGKTFFLVLGPFSIMLPWKAGLRSTTDLI